MFHPLGDYSATHVVALGLEPVQRLLSTLVTLGNVARAPK